MTEFVIYCMVLYQVQTKKEKANFIRMYILHVMDRIRRRL